MIGRDNRQATVEMLRRMISYIRDEAVRLHVMDVALLLEQAEDAVTAFAPPALASPARSMHEAGRVEH